MPRRSRHTIAKLFPCRKAFVLSCLPFFLISLLPVCRLAFYAHPAGDDYAYGVAAHLAWTDTHSLSAVLAAAVSNVKGYYTSWQGTYSSIFLMSLQPAIFQSASLFSDHISDAFYGNRKYFFSVSRSVYPLYSAFPKPAADAFPGALVSLCPCD